MAPYGLISYGLIDGGDLFFSPDPWRCGQMAQEKTNSGLFTDFYHATVLTMHVFSRCNRSAQFVSAIRMFSSSGQSHCFDFDYFILASLNIT